MITVLLLPDTYRSKSRDPHIDLSVGKKSIFIASDLPMSADYVQETRSDRTSRPEAPIGISVTNKADSIWPNQNNYRLSTWDRH